jgi:hypothetical protein
VPKNEFVFELAEVWHMDIMRRRIEMNCKVVSRSPRSQRQDLETQDWCSNKRSETQCGGDNSMNDELPGATTKAPARSRPSAKKLPPQLAGDVTFIQIPLPPSAAMNKDRPISSLIQAQLRHIGHAESARLPKDKRLGIKPEEIRTEAEAASYIAAVTKLLHPQRRKKSKPQSSS